MAPKTLVELPNLLLSTTYALNKSNTKRATVGLEYHGGLHRTVIKLCGTGSPSKYITLTADDWEMIVDQMVTMDEYLRHSYVSTYSDFGVPQKIFLPKHDISFTTAYGARAIAIDERPVVEKSKVTYVENDNAVSDVAEIPPSQPSNQTGESAMKKKRRFENPPGIILQYGTFEGLRDMRECITERLKRLENDSAFVNRVYDMVLKFLKEKIISDTEVNAKELLKECHVFKKYYCNIRMEIDERILNESQSFFANENCLEILLNEFYAFCLPAIATDLFNIMYE